MDKKIFFIILVLVLVIGCIQGKVKQVEITNLNFSKTIELLANENVKKTYGEFDGWFRGIIKIQVKNHFNMQPNVTLTFIGVHKNSQANKTMRFFTGIYLDPYKTFKIFLQNATYEFSIEPQSEKTIEIQYSALYIGNYTIRVTLKHHDKIMDEKELKINIEKWPGMPVGDIKDILTKR